MSMNGEHLKSMSPDPKGASLNDDWKDHVRQYEDREAVHHETLDRERFVHDQHVAGKLRQANMTEEIELDHLRDLRQTRSEMDREVSAAHAVAARALASLGLPYVPGKTTIDDVYAVARLSPSDAADRAGLPGVFYGAPEGMKVLKWAGMAGCLVLGTVGMGALVLRIPPRALLMSPLFLPIAIGLSAILIGGTSMIVQPTWRRVGTMKAARPKDGETSRALAGALALTLLAAIIVAAVDAKAILAINASRALVNPDLAPSFLVALVVALALSAAYVLGASVTCFNEAFGIEAGHRIEAEQKRHFEDQLADRKLHIEVQQACDALNNVWVLEDRRNALSGEIKRIEQEYRESVGDTYGSLPKPPEMEDDKARELNVLQRKTKFAGWKLLAHRGLPSRPQGESQTLRGQR